MQKTILILCLLFMSAAASADTLTLEFEDGFLESVPGVGPTTSATEVVTAWVLQRYRQERSISAVEAGLDDYRQLQDERRRSLVLKAIKKIRSTPESSLGKIRKTIDEAP